MSYIIYRTAPIAGQFFYAGKKMKLRCTSGRYLIGFRTGLPPLLSTFKKIVAVLRIEEMQKE